MLASCRTEDEGFAVPKFDLVREDVEGFMDALRGFHEQFRHCFSRSEPREHFFNYMVGQFSPLERKSIEPMALHIEGGNVRGMQRFISELTWQDEAMLRTYRGLVAQDLGDSQGVMIVDETGFSKKGNDSVGVARQYCGPLGKVDNCQVGVFAAYASRYGYALVDKRLFMPQKWFSDAYTKRRETCQVPREVAFESKPTLAKEMLETIRHEGQLPFRYIVADSLYGNSPEFLEALDGFIGVTSLVAVPATPRCWLQRPVTQEKRYRYKGQKHAKRVVAATAQEPSTVKALAETMHPYFWYRRTVSEGTKGPITYEFARRRVTLCKDDLPWKTYWLVLKRTVGAEPTYSYYLSNAPESTPLSVFVWLRGMRWAIEQCFEETKTELGMAHYEVRKYAGWHHHMMTCMLAHFFLWHLQIQLGKKSTRAYGITSETLIIGDLTAENVHHRRCS